MTKICFYIKREQHEQFKIAKRKAFTQDNNDVAAGEDRVIEHPALTAIQSLFHR